MIVLNDLYDYGLKIYQNTDYFKFSLDSILLAEFVKIKPTYRILDMCTGNAPIPLILSTKSKSIKIDGVEIQKEIYELAVKSVSENNLEQQISIYNNDVKSYREIEKYDVVTCNPPYFKENTYKTENIVKRIARHEEKITLKEAIESAHRLLKPNGTFYIVQRTDRFLETCEYLTELGFGIRDTVFVFTKSDQIAEFFLLEASKYKKTDIKIQAIYTESLDSYQKIFQKVKER